MYQTVTFDRYWVNVSYPLGLPLRSNFFIYQARKSISNRKFCCFCYILARWYTRIPKLWKSSGSRLRGKPKVGPEMEKVGILGSRIPFLAALSRSRSLVVGPLVGPSVQELCQKVTFRVSNGN